MNVSEIVQNAYEVAKKAREKSYSPYSKFKVGCGLKFKDSDVIYAGTNVENVSFGGTICAERSAIVQGVGQGEKKIDFLVVVSDLEKPVFPCGICLQFILEFSDETTKVYGGNLKSLLWEHSLKDLLPHGFTDFLSP